VTGTAYADVSLKTLAKLVLLTRHASVPVPIETSLDVAVPGGAIGRKSALALLDAAQAAWDVVGGRWQAATKLFSQWRRQLWDAYAPAMVLAYSTYQLRDRAGTEVQLDATAAGFRVDGKRVLLPKSVLQPWKFDPSVAASMKQDSGLKVAQYDLWLWPANARMRDDSNQLVPPAWRLSANQLRLLPFTNDDYEKMLMPVEGSSRPLKIRVHRREGAAALGLVEITDPAAPAVSARLDDSGQKNQFDSVALFRFPGGADAREARPDLIFVAASRNGTTLKLTAKVDSTGWGSPVISPDGVVGVVVDQDSAVPLEDAERLLNFQSKE
jgi:hypothetical protein